MIVFANQFAYIVIVSLEALKVKDSATGDGSKLQNERTLILTFLVYTRYFHSYSVKYLIRTVSAYHKYAYPIFYDY